jgi:hypothetical protein
VRMGEAHSAYSGWILLCSLSPENVGHLPERLPAVAWVLVLTPPTRVACMMLGRFLKAEGAGVVEEIWDYWWCGDLVCWGRGG